MARSGKVCKGPCPVKNLDGDNNDAGGGGGGGTL